MTAVYAAGHWRRRDALAGLAPAMREAIALMASDGKLTLRGGDYWPAIPMSSVRAATLAACAARGLAVQRFDPLTGRAFYRLTRRGREIAAEIARRAATRARLQGAVDRARHPA
jgi:hypothetical protein